MHTQRIISLLPSATEVVTALGLRDRLIGRSHECDFPEDVRDLSVCSQPKYQANGSSPEIGKEVQSILREALSIYNVDVERIKTLAPTHIITQSQCAVCAVSTSELEDAICTFLNRDDIAVIDLNDESLDMVLANMVRVADALDVHQNGEALVSRMRGAFEEIYQKTQGENKPRVAHLEWVEPMMTAGGWMMTLIPTAGGVNVFPDEAERWITFEQLAGQDPDKIVIAPCGFSIERTLQDMHYLEAQPGWKDLKAVRDGEVYVADGNHYFNRPGPRLVDSTEILAEVFHPECFDAKHRQTGWIKYN
jgi:iron complex transport system substrate-binding protein